jgi:glutathione S-transferase
MFAPVAVRFRSYIRDLADFGDSGAAARYVETIFDMPEMAAWEAGACSQNPA